MNALTPSMAPIRVLERRADCAIQVALATHNSEAYLPALLDSLFDQTRQDFTLLVSDDGHAGPPELREARDDGRVVGELPIAVQLDPVGHQRRHVQFAADFRDRQRAVPEPPGREARHDTQVRQPRQLRREIVGNAFSQILTIRAVPEIAEYPDASGRRPREHVRDVVAVEVRHRDRQQIGDCVRGRAERFVLLHELAGPVALEEDRLAVRG